MAIFNEILSPRFAGFIKKLFSMKQQAAARQVSGEVMPIVPFFSGRENRFLEHWDTFANFFAQGPVAAQNSAVMIRNPVGSNIVAVFEKISFFESIADTNVQLMHGNRATDLGTALGSGGTTRLDRRGRSASTLLLSKENNSAIGGTLNNIFNASIGANAVPLDYILTDIQELPLLPGDALALLTGAVNTSLIWSLMWRERLLEESERQ